MKKRKFFAIVLSAVMLAVSVVWVSVSRNRSEMPVESMEISQIKKEISEVSSETETPQEMRGVWIPYLSLTLSAEERTESGFHAKIDDMVQRCEKYRINTAIVQVRPFGDAIYPSKLFPWSHILMGEQGKAPGFDPLAYIIRKFHEKNIAVHAWVNPYRISTGKTPSVLSDNNPCTEYPTFVYENALYYDPSSPEVRKLMIDGIAEIVRNYDVDGIQLDDYFYPSEDLEYDKKSYDEYAKSVKSDFLPVSQSEWRKTNVNMLVEGIYAKVHSLKEKVVFGIAPQCNFDNNEKMGADVGVWCSQKGYVDYICPQLYVSNNHPTFPFNPLADRWKATVTDPNIKLYFGLGVYKAGSDADSGTWLLSDDNLQKQIEYGRTVQADGFMLYSYDYLESDDTQKEVQNAAAILE